MGRLQDELVVHDALAQMQCTDCGRSPEQLAEEVPCVTVNNDGKFTIHPGHTFSIVRETCIRLLERLPALSRRH